MENNGPFELVSIEFFGGNYGGRPTASVWVKTPYQDASVHDSGNGVGVIDAMFKALERATRVQELRGAYRLNRWSASPLNGRGRSDSPCEAVVNIQVGSDFGLGKGNDFDTVIASAKAFVAARNDLQKKIDKHTGNRLLSSVELQEAEEESSTFSGPTHA